LTRTFKEAPRDGKEAPRAGCCSCAERHPVPKIGAARSVVALAGKDTPPRPGRRPIPFARSRGFGFRGVRTRVRVRVRVRLRGSPKRWRIAVTAHGGPDVSHAARSSSVGRRGTRRASRSSACSAAAAAARSCARATGWTVGSTPSKRWDGRSERRAGGVWMRRRSFLRSGDGATTDSPVSRGLLFLSSRRREGSTVRVCFARPLLASRPERGGDPDDAVAPQLPSYTRRARLLLLLRAVHR
jgi:hypothetical protein